MKVLSELAVKLNGYDIGGFDYYFAFDPDVQLNHLAGQRERQYGSALWSILSVFPVSAIPVWGGNDQGCR